MVSSDLSQSRRRSHLCSVCVCVREGEREDEGTKQVEEDEWFGKVSEVVVGIKLLTFSFSSLDP